MRHIMQSFGVFIKIFTVRNFLNVKILINGAINIQSLCMVTIKIVTLNLMRLHNCTHYKKQKKCLTECCKNAKIVNVVMHNMVCALFLYDQCQ